MKTKTGRPGRKLSVTEGSGNVFADLGLPNPEQKLLKARLTLEIHTIIKERGLTQVEAAKLLGIRQPAGIPADPQQVRQFLGGAPDGAADRPRTGCRDRSAAYAQDARANVRGGSVNRRSATRHLRGLVNRFFSFL